MAILRLLAACAMIAGLSACSGSQSGVTFAGKNAPPQGMSFVDSLQAAAVAADLQVSAIEVSVPRSLSVSEENRYLPKADIVWRGDAPGDRHQQVQAIVQSAFETGAAGLTGTRPVSVHAQVVRFHALSEKARYSIGGVHNIEFLFEVRDATTGAVLAPARMVRADLEAFGGDEALAADQRGETQKVRITEFLARVLQEELTQPGGHQTAKLGIFQRMNHM